MQSLGQQDPVRSGPWFPLQCLCPLLASSLMCASHSVQTAIPWPSLPQGLWTYYFLVWNVLLQEVNMAPFLTLFWNLLTISKRPSLAILCKRIVLSFPSSLSEIIFLPSTYHCLSLYNLSICFLSVSHSLLECELYEGRDCFVFLCYIPIPIFGVWDLTGVQNLFS